MTSKHIEERQGVYYVPGTRISLDSVVYAFREGCSPETIREDFSGLILAHVYGAIAFYLDHQTEMDAYLLRRREQWDELERRGAPASPDLQARHQRARSSVSLPRQCHLRQWDLKRVARDRHLTMSRALVTLAERGIQAKADARQQLKSTYRDFINEADPARKNEAGWDLIKAIFGEDSIAEDSVFRSSARCLAAFASESR